MQQLAEIQWQHISFRYVTVRVKSISLFLHVNWNVTFCLVFWHEVQRESQRCIHRNYIQIWATNHTYKTNMLQFFSHRIFIRSFLPVQMRSYVWTILVAGFLCIGVCISLRYDLQVTFLCDLECWTCGKYIANAMVS